MRIDFLATHRHFLDHILPVWEALPPEARGNLFTAGPPNKPTGNITVVSAVGDLRKLGGAPSVYMEHGSGYSYTFPGGRKHPSYAGSPERPGVVLFLNTNEQVHDLNRNTHPTIPGKIVGSPKLDRWVAKTLPIRDESSENGNVRPIVTYSTHWACKVAPEAMSAHKEFRWALRPKNRVEEFAWAGHAHPRGWGLVKADYQRFGVPVIKHFDQVMERSDVYVADTTSTLYEFAFTGRPVVCLNASFYRRDVSHGIRFWDYVPGLQVDRWQDVNDAVIRSLAGEGEDLRRRAVDFVYPIQDGTSSKRAAEALLELL